VLRLSLQDVLADALVVGEALGLQQQAAAAVAALQQRMDSAKALVAQLPPMPHPKVIVTLPPSHTGRPPTSASTGLGTIHESMS